MTHNVLSLMKIDKSLMNFISTHWLHQSIFIILNYTNIISKNPWVKCLCINLNLPPGER